MGRVQILEKRQQARFMTQRPPVASFRDPSGNVFVLDDRVLRVVRENGKDELQAFLSSETIRNAMQEGRVVDTRPLPTDEAQDAAAVLQDRDAWMPSPGEGEATIVEHERIPFVSHPYEWPVEMLEAAARLTLDLQENLVEEGHGLKDATPYNVLFNGPRPVFIDALSVEKRDPRDPVWTPNSQFIRTFLLPLLVARDLGISTSDSLLAHRDGYTPESVYQMTSPLTRLQSPYRWLVTLPTWLAGKAEKKGEALYAPKPMKNPEQARFVLRSVTRRLRKQLRKAAPRKGTDSHWSNYTASRSHYSDEDTSRKDAFVQQALEATKPAWVLDVGCNTGQYSTMAAQAGARVVAVDTDPVSVGRLWRQASENDLDVLPLVVDVARPTPAMGWDNAESPSFLQRAANRFDLVFMLAVMHHLHVTERIPVTRIIALADRLTRDQAVIEYVGPEDVMFRRLLRGRGHLHEELTRQGFERLLQERFDVLDSKPLEDSDRVLYTVRSRKAVTKEPEEPMTASTSHMPAH